MFMTSCSTICLIIASIEMRLHIRQSNLPNAEVHHIGEMRNVMRNGDLSARIDLFQMSKLKNLYALGPMEGLRGEITIWNSKPYLARIDHDKIVMSQNYQGKACFLVYACVEDWQEIRVPQDITEEKLFEEWLKKAATTHGVNINRPFPFLIKDTSKKVQYHVVNKSDDGPHSPAKHEMIKKKFTLEDVGVKILGFYSDRHHGIFTHHDSNIHMHVITIDEKQSGHLESIQFGKDTRLYLPK